MSRVQCLDCGIAVVVDPRGVCPEGHVVGSAGVRVANAMGGGSPHPDEPEPWVATVVLDEADARPAPRQRSIRPVPVLGPEEPAEDTEAADHEAMLRELHALGDLHDTPATPSSPAPAPAASARPLSPPAAASTPAASTLPDTSTSPAPPREQFAEGLAELSALEAAFQALGHDETTTPSPAPTAVTPEVTPAPPTTEVSAPPAHPVTAYDELVDYEGLFAAGAEATAVAPTAPPTPTGDMPAASSPGSPPSQASPTTAPASQASPPQAPPAQDVTAPMAAVPPSAPPADVPHAAAPIDGHPSPSAPDPAPTEPEAEVPSTAGARGLDLANFTANGAKVGAGRGGRRKLFGR